MTVFSRKSLARLETIAPHLLTRVSLAEDSEASFSEYVLPENAETYVCFGCGFPPEGAKGKWILIEPSISRLRAFLQCDESERFFSQEVVFVSLEDEVSLRTLSWMLFDTSFSLLDGGYSDFPAFATSFMNRIEGTAHLFNEYADFGVLPMRNMLSNIQEELTRPDPYRGSQAQCDAIVIGAGPSLDKEIDRLLGLANDVILIGCGSAVQIAQKRGVPLDFATYLDPEPPKERYEQVSSTTPFVFLTRTSPDVVSHFSGEKILVGSNGCHPIESYVLEKVGISEILQGGWNAATLGIEWAEYLGCRRIYTVGVDSTIDGYAEGIKDDKQRPIAELRETKEWLEGYAPLSKGFSPKGSKRSVTSTQYRSDHTEIRKLLEKARGDALEAVEGLIKGGKIALLHRFELEQNPWYQTTLTFLWSIWKYRFETANDLAEWEFYKEVLNEFAAS